MNPRLQQIARIACVQKQMHRLAEWRLTELQSREVDLREQAGSLIGSLNGEVPLHGLFVNAMAKRLTSIGIETGAVGKAKEAQAERVLGEGRKLKQAERLRTATAVSVQRDEEKRRLTEAIGNSLARRSYGLDHDDEA